MNQMAQNHKALFELLAKSKDSVILYDKDPVFSLKANEGVYPKLALCYTPEKAKPDGLDKYFKAVEQLKASPYIIIEKNADSAPTELLFKQNGFRPVEEWVSMHISLENFEKVNHGELKIEAVKDEVQLNQWLTVVEKTLFNNNTVDKPVFEQLLPSKNITMWLGFWCNQPICTVLSFIHNNKVGLYMISTLPEFRGKGFGQEITVKALHNAADKGISEGILQATRQGLNLYDKIGFQENGKFIIYWKVGKTYI